MGENTQFDGALHFHREKRNENHGWEMKPNEFILEIKHRSLAVWTINHLGKKLEGMDFP